jgi:hypothetical protein
VAEARFYVYVHRQADTGEVFYVGKGKDRRAWSLSNRNRHWREIVAVHGLTVEVAVSELSENDAFEHERRLIELHRATAVRLANLTTGGQGISGCKRPPESEETRAKKRASALGRPMSPEAIAKTAAFHTGRKRGPETLAKMSASLKGKNVGREYSNETRAKLAAAAAGHKHSAETRARMSASMTGKKKGPQSPEHRAKIALKRKQYWERWRAERSSIAQP